MECTCVVFGQPFAELNPAVAGRQGPAHTPDCPMFALSQPRDRDELRAISLRAVNIFLVGASQLATAAGDERAHDHLSVYGRMSDDEKWRTMILGSKVLDQIVVEDGDDAGGS